MVKRKRVQRHENNAAAPYDEESDSDSVEMESTSRNVQPLGEVATHQDEEATGYPDWGLARERAYYTSGGKSEKPLYLHKARADETVSLRGASKQKAGHKGEIPQGLHRSWATFLLYKRAYERRNHCRLVTHDETSVAQHNSELRRKLGGRVRGTRASTRSVKKTTNATANATSELPAELLMWQRVYKCVDANEPRAALVDCSFGFTAEVQFVRSDWLVRVKDGRFFHNHRLPPPLVGDEHAAVPVVETIQHAQTRETEVPAQTTRQSTRSSPGTDHRTEATATSCAPPHHQQPRPSLRHAFLNSPPTVSAFDTNEQIRSLSESYLKLRNVTNLIYDELTQWEPSYFGSELQNLIEYLTKLQERGRDTARVHRRVPGDGDYLHGMDVFHPAVHAVHAAAAAAGIVNDHHLPLYRPMRPQPQPQPQQSRAAMTMPLYDRRPVAAPVSVSAVAVAAVPPSPAPVVIPPSGVPASQRMATSRALREILPKSREVKSSSPAPATAEPRSKSTPVPGEAAVAVVAQSPSVAFTSVSSSKTSERPRPQPHRVEKEKNVKSTIAQTVPPSSTAQPKPTNGKATSATVTTETDTHSQRKPRNAQDPTTTRAATATRELSIDTMRVDDQVPTRQRPSQTHVLIQAKAPSSTQQLPPSEKTTPRSDGAPSIATAAMRTACTTTRKSLRQSSATQADTMASPLPVVPVVPVVAAPRAPPTVTPHQPEPVAAAVASAAVRSRSRSKSPRHSTSAPVLLPQEKTVVNPNSGASTKKRRLSGDPIVATPPLPTTTTTIAAAAPAQKSPRSIAPKPTASTVSAAPSVAGGSMAKAKATPASKVPAKKKPAELPFATMATPLHSYRGRAPATIGATAKGQQQQQQNNEDAWNVVLVPRSSQVPRATRPPATAKQVPAVPAMAAALLPVAKKH